MAIFCDRDSCNCGVPEDWEHRTPYLMRSISDDEDTTPRINPGDGEMDFNPRNTLQEIHDNLSSRAEEVGALVWWDNGELAISASMTTDVQFIRSEDGSRDSRPVEIRTEIETHDGAYVEHSDIDRLIDISRTMHSVVDEAIENGEMEFEIQ